MDAYTSADRSATFGALAKGTLWSRPADPAAQNTDAGTVEAQCTSLADDRDTCPAWPAAIMLKLPDLE